jgi:predicted ATPase
MGSRILEREAELADAAAEAGPGSGPAVLVFGEAGIGKSSLAEALRGHAGTALFQQATGSGTLR